MKNEVVEVFFYCVTDTLQVCISFVTNMCLLKKYYREIILNNLEHNLFKKRMTSFV